MIFGEALIAAVGVAEAACSGHLAPLHPRGPARRDGRHSATDPRV